MTVATNPFLDSFKDAFSPVTDALKNITVPESAREFVKKSANTAKERTADFRAGSERVTSVIENAATGSVSEVVKMTRNFQQAVYEDADAFFAGLDKLASATSLSEAVQIQSELVRAGGETLASRAKAATEYFGKLVTESAKTAQDGLSTVYTKTA